MKKPGIERPERINGKTAGNADNKIFFLDKCFRIGCAFLKKKVIALFDIVDDFGFIENFFLPDIGIFVTTAAEHVFVVVDVENADRTEIVAGLALKFLFINNLRGQNLIKIIGGLGQKSVGQFLFGQNAHAETTHQFGIRRNENILIQQHGKSQRDGLVLGYAALQNDIFADGPVAHNAVEIIGNDGGDDTGGNIFARRALLNGIADVGIDKGGTMFAELQRLVCCQRDIADFPGIGNIQIALRRFFQKRSGSGEQASFMA